MFPAWFASGDKNKSERPAKGTPGKTPAGGAGPQGERSGLSGRPGPGVFGLLAIGLIGVMLYMMFTSAGSGRKIGLDEFSRLYRDNQIVENSVRVHEDAVRAKQKAGPDSETETVVLVPFNVATREGVVTEIMGITDNKFQAISTSPWLQFFIVWGPLVLVVVFLWFMISRGLRSAGGGGGMLGNFGKSRHRTLTKEMTNVSFSDVAGIDEAKEEVTEIIEFLKNPKKFTKLGGRIPRGVLLVGEPGCGKTLLAKAIAGEADVPFFSISGSDFVEMFVGVGASRVRDLFKQAKDSAPCIIFLDEIDAVGRRRGGGFTTGGHDEREQTLNAILVEMDGFNSTDGVIVIAATNRADVLDPALVRPGRFDRQFVVPLPDLKGRLEILKVHARKIKMSPDLDLEKVARGTPMFSGAELAAIINEAAIGATMLNKESVELADLEEARDKVKFGRARRSHKSDKEDNRATSYHEAGHAVLQYLLTDADPLHKVTIIPRGQALGATFSLPTKDRTGYGLKWLNATMRTACGGRLAEEKATGDIGSGAAMDIMQVTNIARKMILEWGMSPKLGFIRYEGKDSKEMFIADKDYSDQTASIIDAEVHRLVNDAYVDAKRLIDENWEKVVAIAEALLKYETLNLDDVDRLMKGGTLVKPTVSEMIRAEERKRAEAAGVIVAPPIDNGSSQLPPGALPTPA